MSDDASLAKSVESDLTLNEEKTTADGADAEAEADDFSLSLDKKKKKRRKKVKEAPDENTVSAGADTDASGVVGELSSASPSDDYNYTELLERVFSLLQEKNPSLGSRKRYSMPPPQLVRVGTRKTMWTNFSAICTLMHRQPEHVMSFLLAELGTDGSIDGSQRMIIKGRYQGKQVESLLRKYITEYVTCHMCQKPETSLTRDSVTRLYFVNCESCGSRRSVAPIKSGFHATMRAERRKAMNEQ